MRETLSIALFGPRPHRVAGLLLTLVFLHFLSVDGEIRL